MGGSFFIGGDTLVTCWNGNLEGKKIWLSRNGSESKLRDSFPGYRVRGIGHPFSGMPLLLPHGRVMCILPTNP